MAKAAANTDALLASANECGLRLSARDGRLVVRGPANANPDLVRALLDRKADILWVLLRPEPDEWHAWEERAAIAEYDGRLPQAEAETLAWAELQAARAGTNSANSHATRATGPGS
jgi:hypothetical protein